MKQRYWSFHRLPEVADLPKAQRMAVLQAAMPTLLQQPRMRLAFLLFGGMCLSGIALVIALVPISLWGAILVGSAWTVVGSIGVTQVAHSAMRPILAAQRAAMTPQPQHDDGSYWVPPAV